MAKKTPIRDVRVAAPLKHAPACRLRDGPALYPRRTRRGPVEAGDARAANRGRVYLSATYASRPR